MEFPNTIRTAMTEEVMRVVKTQIPEIQPSQYNRIYEVVYEKIGQAGASSVEKDITNPKKFKKHGTGWFRR